MHVRAGVGDTKIESPTLPIEKILDFIYPLERGYPLPSWLGFKERDL